MTDIQRWTAEAGDLWPDDIDSEFMEQPILVVIYADHVAAIAAEKLSNHTAYDLGYQQAIRDAVSLVEVLLPEEITSDTGRGYDYGVRRAIDSIKTAIEHFDVSESNNSTSHD